MKHTLNQNHFDIRLGDCLDVLKGLKENSVDSVVCDPPYGLSFMGKKWDYDVPSQEIWKECLRVLKPGGHLLAFAGSRTYHRMVVRIEDAGFEIRDQIMWIYGSGFPKSMNISKQIDKKPIADLSEFAKALKERRLKLGLSLSEADKLITGGTTMYSFLEGRKDNDVYPPNKEYWVKIKEHFGMDEWSSIIENSLKAVGEEEGSFGYQKDGERWGETRTLTETTTDLAKKWEGWGTALKPAHEPIVMARKPFKGSVAENVLEWGTGGINIDDSRIGLDDDLDKSQLRTINRSQKTEKDGWGMNSNSSDTPQMVRPEGRFPANVIFDEEAGKLLDEQTGILNKQGKCKTDNKSGWQNEYVGGDKVNAVERKLYLDKGGASRFFYCPKASKKDRNEGCDKLEEKQRPAQTDKGNYSSSPYCKDCGKTHNGTNDHSNCSYGVEYRPSTTTTKNNHPTIKPTDLMLYLIRLVTPKEGTTLDPFMGSGSTGKAALKAGFSFVGIEREKEYFEIAKARLEHQQKKNKGKQINLFD